MDLEAAIRLLQEVKKIASPEDLAALRKYTCFFDILLEVDVQLQWSIK
jgi:hypothetical protein